MERRHRLLLALLIWSIAGVAAKAACVNTSFFRTEGTTVRNTRAVDDYVAPVGTGGVYRIGGLSTRVATNCSTFEVWFEIYDSDVLGRPWHKIFTGRALSVSPTGRTLTIEGRAEREYNASLVFQIPQPPEIRAGSRIWLSAFVKDTFSLNERGHCIADSDNTDSPRLPMTQNAAGAAWTSTPAGTCGLAIKPFLRQYCPADLNRSGGAPDSTDWAIFTQAYLSHQPAADFDGNGSVNQLDLQAYIAAFQTPCPPPIVF